MRGLIKNLWDHHMQKMSSNDAPTEVLVFFVAIQAIKLCGVLPKCFSSKSASVIDVIDVK